MMILPNYAKLCLVTGIFVISLETNGFYHIF